MNPMHQLTRRPVKAAFGALLLALAGVILALSGGQFWAAVQTRAGVEETYTTVAVVTGGKRQLVSSGDIVYEDIGPTYEANEFLKEAAQKGWSIIRGQATMGLAGGYSPKLTPLTTFYQMDVDSSDTRIDNDEDVPYNFAILEIEITEVGEERVYYPREYDTGAFFNWVVSGKVLGVQAMSGDWNDPTGRNANFYLQITGESDAAGKALQAGQRILVFTHNYRDLDFEQRCLIAEDLRLSGYEVDPRSLDIENNLIRYADRTTAITITDGEGNPWPDDAPLYKDPVTGNESTIDLRRLNTIAFNVDDCSQPWTLYDEQWNVEEQKWEWTVQRVIAYDTDYDLASLVHPLSKYASSFECFVYQNYKKVKTVEEFAKLGGYSQTTFRRIFDNVFHEPVYEWMLSRRKEEIIYELQNTEATISEICYKFGFESLPHFSNFCKKSFGTSPRSIRLKRSSE